MRNKIKIILTLCFIMLLAGCGKTDKTEKPPQPSSENAIIIYYPKGIAVVADKDEYQLKQPDSLSASVEEIMVAYADKIGDGVIKYHTYMIDGDNNVTLEFSLEGDYSKDFFLLIRATVTKTLFQIDDIEKITVKLVDHDDNIITEEAFDRKSFYYYGEN